jgi:hypothetical protein
MPSKLKTLSLAPITAKKQNKKHGKECLVNVTGMASVCNGILPKI